MTREEAQEFANEIEKRVMMYVEQRNEFDRIDELDEALIAMDKSIMNVMDILVD